MLTITITDNIPINRRTLELDPDTTSRAEFLASGVVREDTHCTKRSEPYGVGFTA
jgi:hypothetical protein